MATAHEIYWALNRRRDPKMVAAATEARAIGVKIEEGWESVMKSVMVDAAAAIGCRVSNLDASRDHHMAVLSDAMRQMIQDHIDAHPSGYTGSQSSYLKKAK